MGMSFTNQPPSQAEGTAPVVPSRRRERVLAWAVGLALLVSYLYTFPRWADPNQNSRLDMIVAVVDDGTFQIDPYVGNTVDYARLGGHYYSDKAPGVAFLGVPLYAGLKVLLDTPVLRALAARLDSAQAFQGTLRPEGSGVSVGKVRFALTQVALTAALAALPSALLGLLLFRILRAFTPAAAPRLAVVLGYGLLTPAFAYAGALYGHQLSAALLMAAFALLFLGRRHLSPARLFGTGLLLGYSVISEYPSVLIAAVLSAYALRSLLRQGAPTRLVWLLLGGGLCAAGLMLYNGVVFGGPFNLGYQYSTLWQEQHATGLLSLGAPKLEALWGITFGPFRGLFLLSPWLLAAFPGLVRWWRSGERREEWVVVVASVGLMLTLNVSSVMWWGGFAVGPRYLLPALPFLALPVVFVLREPVSRGWGWVLGLLALWSWVATWGLTLAEQAFPPDTLSNPLLQYALPNWLAANVARNMGVLLGLSGPLSLAPLFLLLAAIGLGAWVLVGRGGAGIRVGVRAAQEVRSQ